VTVTTPVESTPAPPAAATPPAAAKPAPAGPPPVASPNRRRIDNRFPVLAFNLQTRGHTFFEMLLTTDRSLFDPANASHRTPSNFYAGRQDGGLMHSTGDETSYVVPAAVLKRFAEARPRAREIFYTVAVYDAPDGAPLLAQPPNVLAATAPSVLLGADFQAQTLAAVLSVPAEKLQHMGDPPMPQPAAAYGAPEVDDDGIPIGEAQSWSSDDDEEQAAIAAEAAWVADPHALALDAQDEPLLQEGLAAEPMDPGPIPEVHDDPMAYPYSAEPGDDYDDEMAYAGETAYEDEPPMPDEEMRYDDGFGYSAEADFPAGASEPMQLADDDDHLDDELAMEAAYEEPYEEDAMYGAAYGNGNGAAPAAAPVHPIATMPPPGAGAHALDIPGKVAIVTKLGRKFEASHGYAGITPDSEFENQHLPQYHRWHVGLSYGFIQFTQDSGMLGHLLQMMQQRDPAKFAEVFGPDAPALIATTTARGQSSAQAPGGRGPRVQPVSGHDIWTEPWLSRFRAAGAHPAFQAAQNELAVRAFVDPVLGYAGHLGLSTERALAMVVDRAIQLGTGGAQRWLDDNVAPIRTDAERMQALGALGLGSIADFQRAAGLHQDGNFGPRTRAALVGALRALGPASPVPIPTRDQLMDAIVARATAAGVFWASRPRTIRTDHDFADVELTWTAAPAQAHHH